MALVILGGSGDTVVNPEVREALEEELGLNDPLVVQYGRWLWNMVSGEFGGRSLETREPIRSIVGRQLPVTALLTGYTILLSVVVSLPLGVLAAAKSNRLSDYVVRLMTLGGLAIPSLWVALLTILFLLIFFRWSPPLVYAAPWSDPWVHLQKMVWPAAHPGLGAELSPRARDPLQRAGGPQSGLHNNGPGQGAAGALDCLAARSCPTPLSPLSPMIGLQLGALLSGALILETIFGLPGIGRGLVQAALARDYPVIQSLAALLVLLSLVVNLVVDTINRLIDPRAST